MSLAPVLQHVSFPRVCILQTLSVASRPSGVCAAWNCFDLKLVHVPTRHPGVQVSVKSDEHVPISLVRRRNSYCHPVWGEEVCSKCKSFEPCRLSSAGSVSSYVSLDRGSNLFVLSQFVYVACLLFACVVPRLPRHRCCCCLTQSCSRLIPCLTCRRTILFSTSASLPRVTSSQIKTFSGRARACGQGICGSCPACHNTHGEALRSSTPCTFIALATSAWQFRVASSVLYIDLVSGPHVCASSGLEESLSHNPRMCRSLRSRACIHG